jgi:Putative zinc-finger
MEKMDHNQAIQLQAAVKYVLGELSQVQREEYEEHYFDCAECAVDLQALATFADTTREVLRQEKANVLAAEPVPARGGWLRWLQPVTAVPVFAALLLIIAYQNTVTIPRAREEATSGAAQLFVSSRTPKMAVTRGGEEVKFSVRPNESLPLKFDFTPSPSFDAYVCQLQDESGRSILQLRVPGSFTNKELNLVVPANRLKPGKYALVFTADPGAKGQPTKDEVLRLDFAVEFLQ